MSNPKKPAKKGPGYPSVMIVPIDKDTQLDILEHRKDPRIDRVLTSEEAHQFLEDTHRQDEADALKALKEYAYAQEARIKNMATYIKVMDHLAEEREAKVKKLTETLEKLELEIAKLR